MNPRDFKTTPLPVEVYANEWLCQVLFFRSDEYFVTAYADRKGQRSEAT
ncbi:MAG: hypothetical protein P4K94_08805 [Terracidiphilus sp.]|nr:hypothetical protein [Terracidiphilus sp.]